MDRLEAVQNSEKEKAKLEIEEKCRELEELRKDALDKEKQYLIESEKLRLDMEAKNEELDNLRKALEEINQHYVDEGEPDFDNSNYLDDYQRHLVDLEGSETMECHDTVDHADDVEPDRNAETRTMMRLLEDHRSRSPEADDGDDDLLDKRKLHLSLSFNEEDEEDESSRVEDLPEDESDLHLEESRGKEDRLIQTVSMQLIRYFRSHALLGRNKDETELNAIQREIGEFLNRYDQTKETSSEVIDLRSEVTDLHGELDDKIKEIRDLGSEIDRLRAAVGREDELKMGLEYMEEEVKRLKSFYQNSSLEELEKQRNELNQQKLVNSV